MAALDTLQRELGVDDKGLLKMTTARNLQDAKDKNDALLADAKLKGQAAAATKTEEEKTPKGRAEIAKLQAETQKAQAETQKTQQEVTQAKTDNATSNLIGEDFLKTLPPAQSEEIRQIHDGRMAPENISRLLAYAQRKGGRDIMGQLAQAFPNDPGFDTSKLAAYPKMVHDFISLDTGKPGKILHDGSTALGHLADALRHNTNMSHIPHTPAYEKYQTDITQLSNELANFYRDNTIPGIENIKNELNSQLPGMREAGIREAAKLMGERLDNLVTRWQEGSPSSMYEAKMPDISPSAKAARKYLDPEGYAARYGNASPTPAPPPGATTVIKNQAGTVVGHRVNGVAVGLDGKPLGGK